MRGDREEESEKERKKKKRQAAKMFEMILSLKSPLSFLFSPFIFSFLLLLPPSTSSVTPLLFSPLLLSLLSCPLLLAGLAGSR